MTGTRSERRGRGIGVGMIGLITCSGVLASMEGKGMQHSVGNQSAKLHNYDRNLGYFLRNFYKTSIAITGRLSDFSWLAKKAKSHCTKKLGSRPRSSEAVH